MSNNQTIRERTIDNGGVAPFDHEHLCRNCGCCYATAQNAVTCFQCNNGVCESCKGGDVNYFRVLYADQVERDEHHRRALIAERDAAIGELDAARAFALKWKRVSQDLARRLRESEAR